MRLTNDAKDQQQHGFKRRRKRCCDRSIWTDDAVVVDDEAALQPMMVVSWTIEICSWCCCCCCQSRRERTNGVKGLQQQQNHIIGSCRRFLFSCSKSSICAMATEGICFALLIRSVDCCLRRWPLLVFFVVVSAFSCLNTNRKANAKTHINTKSCIPPYLMYMTALRASHRRQDVPRRLLLRRNTIALFAFLAPVQAWISVPRSYSPCSRKAIRDVLRMNNNPSFEHQYQAASTGLSKFHQSILQQQNQHQRFVTGEYPLTVTLVDSPTRKWLGQLDTAAGNVQVLVNGTAPARSLASMDRFSWLDDEERTKLLGSYGIMSLELLAEIHIERPGYLHLLPSAGAGASAASTAPKSTAPPFRFGSKLISVGDGIANVASEYSSAHATQSSAGIATATPPSDDDDENLWITGFSLTGSQGRVTSVSSKGVMKRVNDRTASRVMWPNEVHWVPKDIWKAKETSSRAISQNHLQHRDALLVSDGFLVPGKDRGGLYVITSPGNTIRERASRLTRSNDRWFYHRAVWIDLTNDGRQSILTARCRISTIGMGKNEGVTSGLTKDGQLVLLQCPEPHSIDQATGTPLEADGTQFDPLDPRHLPWKETVLTKGPDVMFSVADLDPTDDTVEVLSSQFFGKAIVLHSIKRGPQPKVVFERIIDDKCGTSFGSILADLDCASSMDRTKARCRVINSGSVVETLKEGDAFSHLLVTSHEQSFDTNGKSSTLKENQVDGGSLFSYRVPEKKGAWKTDTWRRTTIATGFKVNGQLGNMINPGAPGFAYVFYAKKDDRAIGRRPMIAIAGDCAESAYLLRPESRSLSKSKDPSSDYKLMVEIKCGATVGSIGIGYGEFTSAEQERGYAKLYVPCYEKDKVLVFALGSGSDDEDGGW